MPILRRYPSPRGFTITPVHYTHDPAKAGIEWYSNERAKYDDESVWQREYELDFGAHVGAPVYTPFRRSFHVVEELPIYREYPLDLCCDFNVQPMVWEISQIVGGWEHVCEEIIIHNSATVDAMVQIFRTMHPTHGNIIRVYGDSSGKKRGQSAKTDYHLMEIALRGYPVPVEFRVPPANPLVKKRTAAVNRKLSAIDSRPGAKIAARCVNLIDDLEQVVWHPKGEEILKIYKFDDPYSKRTHASDAWGYKIAREWPVTEELRSIRARKKSRPEIKDWLGKL